MNTIRTLAFLIIAIAAAACSPNAEPASVEAPVPERAQAGEPNRDHRAEPPHNDGLECTFGERYCDCRPDKTCDEGLACNERGYCDKAPS